MHTFYEFFAGGGMARIGLGDRWQCLFANDCSPQKTEVYAANFSDAPSALHVGDVKDLLPSDLPGTADLAWASFPCQDLSLAGNGVGLDGTRSGAFWHFWELIRDLDRDGRAPAVLTIENVLGTLTSHGGADFTAIAQAIWALGYFLGALTIDASHFLPQSRPRVFLVAASNRLAVPESLRYGHSGPTSRSEKTWHSDRLLEVYAGLPEHLKKAWVWWRLQRPAPRSSTLADLLEAENAVEWHTQDATNRLLSMMSETNRRKVALCRQAGVRMLGTAYRRTRLGVQRAEVRFDGISGCLRTPEGGSSRQIILEVNGDCVRSRLLTPREAARLMGLPDTYKLPANANHAYHISGDGLAVPVVAWLERNLLRPLLEGEQMHPFAPIESGELFAHC